MKLAIIGASYKFVKRVINDFILTGEFEDAEIVVVDISQEPLDIVVNTAKAIIDDSRSKIRISGTLDRKKALEGADFVLLSISTGGLKAQQADLNVLQKYDLSPGKESTTGPAALMESLRVIPAVLDIAKDMEAICPDAWIINVSNPMTAIVQSVSLHSKVKVLGLCHGSAGGIETIGELYGVPASDVSANVIGVNHLTFATDIHIQGRNVMDTFYEDAKNAPRQWHGELSLEFFKEHGYFALNGDGYLKALLPYYLENHYDLSKVAEGREHLKQLHIGIANGTITNFAPTHMSGEDIHGVILSLYYGKEEMIYANMLNQGQHGDQKSGSVIETAAFFSKDKMEGIKVNKGTHSPFMTAALYQLNVMYDYTVQAAVTGNRKMVYEALSLDPVTRNSDVVHMIPRLADELIAVNQSYLPNF